MRRYVFIERDDTCDWNFILRDQQSNIIDVHVITFDDVGNGIYCPVENGVYYPASSLLAWGMVHGQSAGYRLITISECGTNIAILLVSFLIILISWIMAEACKLQEKNNLTV